MCHMIWLTRYGLHDMPIVWPKYHTIFRNHKSESNRSGKITFSNMAELNLLIRKLIQNGNRDSAIQLIETIIQRIEAKNKVNNHK